MPMINLSKEKEATPWGICPGSDSILVSSDASLFSSSVPVLLHEKLTLNDDKHGHQSIDDASPSLKKIHPDVEIDELLDDIENHAIGSLLPDDEDELLAGIMDGFDPSRLPNHTDDLEEYDIFGSGGGFELESDGQEHLNLGISRVSLADPVGSNGAAIYGFSNGGGMVTGEHPLGEHPSRTLFVRNINSNVEDSELRALFEQYGDIRTLYTACKHRGFVMISYFDIRAARTAMRALQNKPLRRRKLDIHFSIPKDNPSDKDVNQGTLVVFNLDPSVSNDDLRQIFGAYGEIKEIRETPHKRHHKFIEYYDVRAAEAALRSLNRSDIAGKRIKLEPSRPGGARRNDYHEGPVTWGESRIYFAVGFKSYDITRLAARAEVWFEWVEGSQNLMHRTTFNKKPWNGWKADPKFPYSGSVRTGILQLKEVSESMISHNKDYICIAGGDAVHKMDCLEGLGPYSHHKSYPKGGGLPKPYDETTHLINHQYATFSLSLTPHLTPRNGEMDIWCMDIFNFGGPTLGEMGPDTM
ncbi:Protein MEI2-like 5 [Capsicum annuum]|nr:Protein MEI2-like 5 [Capsicum annuum]